MSTSKQTDKNKYILLSRHQPYTLHWSISQNVTISQTFHFFHNFKKVLERDTKNTSYCSTGCCFLFSFFAWFYLNTQRFLQNFERLQSSQTLKHKVQMIGVHKEYWKTSNVSAPILRSISHWGNFMYQ